MICKIDRQALIAALTELPASQETVDFAYSADLFLVSIGDARPFAVQPHSEADHRFDVPVAALREASTNGSGDIHVMHHRREGYYLFTTAGRIDFSQPGTVPTNSRAQATSAQPTVPQVPFDLPSEMVVSADPVVRGFLALSLSCFGRQKVRLENGETWIQIAPSVLARCTPEYTGAFGTRVTLYAGNLDGVEGHYVALHTWNLARMSTETSIATVAHV